MSSSTSFAPRGATSAGGLSADDATSGAFAPTNSASAFVTPGYDVSLTPVSRALSLRAASDELDDDGDGDGDDGPWTTEDSGTNTDGDSGDDGIGGTYTWSEVDTWDIVNTTDSAGNSSYTEHDTHTYVFQESGTTPDGINYTMNYTSTDTYSASRQGDSSGSHSTSDEETDASYQDHADDGQGDTRDDSGSYHSTTTGYNNSGPGIHWGTTSDSHSEDNYAVHDEPGSNTIDESGSDFATGHSESNSYWLDPFSPYSGAASQTHDDGGQDSGSTSLSDGSGDTDDSGYSDEYTDHSESQTAYDVSIGLNTYTASANSSDDGSSHNDVNISDGGNTESYGTSSNYQDQSQSSIDSNGNSTSSYSGSGGSSDYGSIAISDDDGDSASGGYIDHSSYQYQGGSNSDGAIYSSYSVSGGGSDHDSTYLVNGVDTLGVNTHDTYSYTASGGTNSDGSTYGTSSGSADGGGDFSQHEQGSGGDSLDDSGAFGYQEQDDNGVDTETNNGAANYVLVISGTGTTSGSSSYSSLPDPSFDGSILNGLLLNKMHGKKSPIPQQWSTLTDSAGNSYSVENAAQLTNALTSIKTQGLMVDELNIKGHGWDEGMQLTDGSDPDTISCIQGHILINDEDVTQLLDDVTGVGSRIFFAGCDTGPFAQSVSATLGDGTEVVGNTLRYAVGIPWTPVAIGWYQSYVDGNPAP